jgi:hypothetical protein
LTAVCSFALCGRFSKEQILNLDKNKLNGSGSGWFNYLPARKDVHPRISSTLFH